MSADTLWRTVVSSDAFWSTLVGAVVSALVTWFVAWWYYKRAGDELKGEAQALRRKSDMILTALERNDMVELHRHPDTGEIKGFLLRLRGTAFAGVSHSKGSLTVEHIPRPETPESSE